MVEVYNEAIYDLLASPEDFHEKLTIQKKGKDIVIPVSLYTWLKLTVSYFYVDGLGMFLTGCSEQGLTEVEVRSTQDILSALKEGENNRTVASTKMNTNRWAFSKRRNPVEHPRRGQFGSNI